MWNKSVTRLYCIFNSNSTISTFYIRTKRRESNDSDDTKINEKDWYQDILHWDRINIFKLFNFDSVMFTTTILYNCSHVMQVWSVRATKTTRIEEKKWKHVVESGLIGFFVPAGCCFILVWQADIMYPCTRKMQHSVVKHALFLCVVTFNIIISKI